MENHGADVTSSVSSETDFLVTGENPGQSKLESAKDLNTEILDSDEFMEKFLEEVT
ncbi:MAG: BRCT domain-containing protein [Candidatus Aenigmatarchaeota archaeon]